ncbi:integral membrane sensor signal transduction histidine kinase [Actinobacteria bacterium OK074]|nr:integral membrane sensor signal transduction histidine kinase [Actinobacteria bacterium OK074]
MNFNSWQRYSDEHPRSMDAVVAALVFLGFVIGSKLESPGSQLPRVGPALLLGLNSCVSLLVCRSYPRTAVVVTTACAMTASALGYLLTALTLAPVMVALYWLAVRTDRITTRHWGLGVMALVVATALAADPANHPLALKTIGPIAWLLMPMISGNSARLGQAYVEAVQARAEYAERNREEEARLRVAEERMRIARELHDVVAHHLALANAQAGTAAHLARTHPEQAHKVLTGLAETTGSALREMKATVGLLRQAGEPGAPLEPTPGLARLDELTETFTAAGLKVTVTTEGEPQALSPGVDLTAYRIIQEALTNVTKHAATAAAHVRLLYSHHRLIITVTDNGPPPARVRATAAEPGRGFGLIGMRERAHSVGGALKAGHRPEGGFEVTSELPLRSIVPEPEDLLP